MLKKVVNIFLGTVITQGSTILLYMVLARLLPVDDFATFRQLFLILGILTAVSFSALPTSLLYFTGRADSDGEKNPISLSNSCLNGRDIHRPFDITVFFQWMDRVII